MRGKFLRSSILGIKGFCGTHGGSISIITFLLFNWGWSDKDDWRAKWRLKDEMTTEGRNDDWRTKWRLKGEMTTEGRNDDWRAKWRLKDEMTTEGRNDDWRTKWRLKGDEGWDIRYKPMSDVSFSALVKNGHYPIGSRLFQSAWEWKFILRLYGV